MPTACKLSLDLSKIKYEKATFINLLLRQTLLYFAYVKLKSLFAAGVTGVSRFSVQEVKSLGGHFACLCRWFEFNEVKKNIIFQKENENTFKLLIICIVKSLQKEQNSTNLLL